MIIMIMIILKKEAEMHSLLFMRSFNKYTINIICIIICFIVRLTVMKV